jgi:DNA polymerase I
VGLFNDLKDRGLWDSYCAYVVRMEPLLARTSDRGLPVSADRHKELSGQLEQEMLSLYLQMQTTVPLEVKKSKLLLKEPKRGTKVDRETTLMAVTDGWLRVWPFKPSNQQLVRYMRYKGHAVPQHFKTKQGTTNEDELRRLAKRTGDPLYDLVLRYRDAGTVRNNHLHNWRPGPDGRVHPVFYHTATGQLEARRPNTMNAPHHKESGQRFRSVVVAEPGHMLLSFDYRGFHALYLAHLARDRDFERLVRLDVHSYLTAHFLRLPCYENALSWPDDQLRDWLGGIKKEHHHTRNSKVKHALLGYNNGMGYRKLFATYRDFFDREREAKRFLELLDALFPTAAKYRRDTQERAHEQGFLISQFGCIRYFWEVKRYAGNNEWKHGDDAEAAISFPAQNHAHCHLKDVMLRLDAEGWLDRAGFVTPIHDDLTFHCPDSLLDEAVPYIRGVMEEANSITKLSVGVEVKRGQSWNAMTVVP